MQLSDRIDFLLASELVRDGKGEPRRLTNTRAAARCGLSRQSWHSRKAEAEPSGAWAAYMTRGLGLPLDVILEGTGFEAWAASDPSSASLAALALESGPLPLDEEEGDDELEGAQVLELVEPELPPFPSLEGDGELEARP